MAKISIMKVLKSRKKIRFYTILACCLVFAFGVWQVVMNNPFKTRAATGTINDPVILTSTATGIIFDNLYCPADVNRRVEAGANWSELTSGCEFWGSNNGVPNLSGKYVQLGNGITPQTFVMWGDFTPAGVIIKDKVTITHAPLVYNATAPGTTRDRTAELGYWEQFDSTEKDFNISTGAITLSYIAIRKKVSIIASDFVRIEDGAKIDVTGRGYPGATGGGDATTRYPLRDGYPNTLKGAGQGAISLYSGYNGCNGYAWAAGGSGAKSGGLGGNGRNYDKNGTPIACGTYYSYEPVLNTLDYGAGGGYTGYTNTTSNGMQGFPGGGRVSIQSSTGTVTIFPAAEIHADGSSAVNGWGTIGGAGGGGNINISANKLQYLTDGTVSPNVMGGIGFAGSAYGDNSGAPGVLAGNSVSRAGDHISAVGGTTGATTSWYVGFKGAGGGGGYVYINSTTQTPLCEIAPGSGIDYIPASCENKDVVINGMNQALTGDYLNSSTVKKVYADNVPVFQTTKPDELGCAVVGYVAVFAAPNPVCVRPSSPNMPVVTISVVKGEACRSLVSTNPDGSDLIEFDINCDTKRIFNSLTIKNNGILTHQSVLPADMFENLTHYGGTVNSSLADNTRGIGRLKKVDIETTGDVTLATGGMINANAKGYPGGVGGNTSAGVTGANGYGPGFSVFGRPYLLDTGSGGGGFIGVGGNSSASVSPGGVSYTNTGFDFGSGSGSVFWNDKSYYWSGMAGGGRVRLDIPTGSLSISATSSISANGGSDVNHSSGSNDASPGGGSGGSISISVSKLVIVNAALTLSVNHGIGGTDGGIGIVTSDINAVATGQIDGSNNIIMSAAGGNCGFGGGGGGGGRIIISKIVQNGFTIKKTLEAVSRPATVSPPNPLFNPYALQKNDKIKVILDLENLTVGQSTTITDEYLKTPTRSTTSAACNGTPTPVQDSTPGGTFGAVSAVWKFTPASTTQTLSYFCTVQ